MAESEFVPTTDQIRDVYHLGMLAVSSDIDIEAGFAMFERWLAQIRSAGMHDAWQEGYAQGSEDERKAAEWDVPGVTASRQNPYREDTV